MANWFGFSYPTTYQGLINIPLIMYWKGLFMTFLLLVPDLLVRAPQKSQAKFTLDDRDLRRHPK